MTQDEPSFQFEISLSVLNHLGRNLYRNFITILGEAISNAWDADANNVWIYIDRENNNFVIKDDGNGMTADSFQNKFLKVGYSKRRENGMRSPGGRPYIGAKGIGKLALLSCADTISVISKTESTDYIQGSIDNSELDEAIHQDMTPDQYPLKQIDTRLFDDYKTNHDKGTIIFFEQTKEDIRNTIPHLKKLISLYFRFSLLDDNFNIYINDELVSLTDIQELSESTEFVWIINSMADPFFDTLTNLKHDSISIEIDENNFRGFIATVDFPRKLKITGTEERVGIDLFVNGRLREKDLLKQIPTARVVESYLYGQIHYDELDSDDEDRFTSSREGVRSNDEKYQKLLSILKYSIIPIVLDQWDELRLSRREEGDDENSRKTKKQRRAASLFNLASNEYDNQDDEGPPEEWINELSGDAEFNISSYVDCFLAENLVRKFISENGIALDADNIQTIQTHRQTEIRQKRNGNLSIDIRESNDDLFYLEMEPLVKLADPQVPGDGYPDRLQTDEKQFTPIRNAVMHTARLTEDAKRRLTSTFDNIKGRVRNLIIRRGGGQ